LAQELTSFTFSTFIQRLAAYKMAAVFSYDEQRALRNLFNTIDLTNSGSITARELQKFLGDYGHHVELDHCKDIIRRNGDGQGRMDFDQFCTCIATTLVKIKGVFLLAALFSELDTTNTGRITSLDLHRLVLQTGAPISHQEIVDIIARCDQDGSGGISFQEFVIAFMVFLQNCSTPY